MITIDFKVANAMWFYKIGTINFITIKINLYLKLKQCFRLINKSYSNELIWKFILIKVKDKIIQNKKNVVFIGKDQQLK